MMGKKVGLIVLSSFLLGASAFAFSFETHPVPPDVIRLLPPQYQQCSSCHADVTPKIYQSWKASKHYIANVKCFQCHGTFNDFYKVPPISKCEACHYQEVKTMKEKAPNMTCWDCHPAHIFEFHGKGVSSKK